MGVANAHDTTASKKKLPDEYRQRFLDNKTCGALAGACPCGDDDGMWLASLLQLPRSRRA